MKNKYLFYSVFCLIPISAMVYYTLKTGLPYFAPIIYAITLMIVLILERFWSWDVSWIKDYGDMKLDIQHFLGNLTLSSVSVALYTFSQQKTSSLISPSTQSALIQYFIGLLIFDFFLYFIHRLSHVYKPLWRLHAIHHSSERIYFLNGQKRHLLHEVLEGLPGFLALFLLGTSPLVVIAILYTVNIHLLFQHANISYKTGWMQKIFSVAELHRWHHQRDWKDVQGNYGAVFSLWDFLLGSALKKTGEAGHQVGLGDSPELVRLSYIKQHLWPFKSNP